MEDNARTGAENRALEELATIWEDPAPSALQRVGQIERLAAVIQLHGSIHEGFQPQRCTAALNVYQCGCRMRHPENTGQVRCELIRLHPWYTPPGLMLFGVVSILGRCTHQHRINGAETLLQAMRRELADFGMIDGPAMLPTAEELLAAVP